jgi:murein DD-endopeptidase MepM/ murein hydrolase activator NlpD
VYLNGNLFPGHTGYFKNPQIAMAFIALDIQLPDQTEMYVTASDRAGNTARAGFPYYLRKRSFKSDIIRLTDNFLNWKMPEFSVDVPENSDEPIIDKFLKVNRELRLENYKEFVEICRSTDARIYWKGEFLRLPRSSRQANFADFRDYQYKGKTIDHQIHQGIDLASVPHSPVPAANGGKVIFAGTIGIYGKTVIIDHGFDVFSTYSHLSGYDVKEEQMVEKGDIIGRTGTTGMAGGDHLHFGILIHDKFVDPVEWWDPVWLKNNIQSKIDTIASRYP